jgi:hypothetical protein
MVTFSAALLDNALARVSSAALGSVVDLKACNDSFCTILIEDITLGNALTEIIARTPSRNTRLLEPDSKHTLNQ